MSNSKCEKCTKTVYKLEAECLSGLTWHKQCFRCQGYDGEALCNLKLTQKTAQGLSGKIYCAKHIPKDKPTAITVEGSMSLSNAKSAQKMGSDATRVSNEKRGDNMEHPLGADVEGSLALSTAKRSQALGSDVTRVSNEKRGDSMEHPLGADVEGSLALSTAKRSQALGSDANAVNEQVRGELAGQRNCQVADLSTRNAISAPKVGTINDQVRGESSHIGGIDMRTETALNAPKVGTINEQVRGTGDRPSQGLDMKLENALNAPKTDVQKDHLGGVVSSTAQADYSHSTPKSDDAEPASVEE